MNLLVLGASGGCGQWVVRLAKERGHSVTALVRPDALMPNITGVKIIRGDVFQDGIIDRALSGKEAVISCLGIKRRSAMNPWSKIVSPPDLTTRTAKILVDIMKRHNAHRVIAISAAGVAESAERMNWLIRFMIARSNIRVAYDDLTGMENIFAESGLDWLAVRPVTLIHGKPTGRARPVEHYGLTSTISRGEVARWMLEAVEQPQPYAEHTVMIASS